MTQYPDRTNTLAVLAGWQAQHAAIDKMMTGIEASMGLDINGTMHETVWGLFNAYTDTLAVEVGDFGGWLAWHALENQMGARGFEAGYDNKMRPIKTLAHLYRLIAESRKRETA